MKLEKLEKLSCLKLKESDKKKIEDSLNDVWKMIEDIKNVEIENNNLENKKELKETIFGNREDVMFNINEKTYGLKNEDGLFETTRVVHKKG